MSAGREASPDDGGGSRRTLLGLQRKLAQTQRVAALGALVGRLAHELGTPLHSVSGHLDLMLADPDLTDELRGRTEIIAGEVRRLSTLIRRYLQRLRAPAPDPTPTDLRALALEVLDLMEPRLRRRRVEAVLDAPATTSEPIACDRDQIEQVLVNLVQNALDAMHDGGTLTLRVLPTETGRAISVRDTGRGIAAEHRDHVFDPFFSTKELGRGSGLGLAICREIARAHGGDVLLDSQRGVGTVVTLVLEPLEPVAAGPE